MVVLATNRPGDLDDAVIDRMDEAIHFDLPGQAQRQQLLGLYLDKYIHKAGTVEVSPGRRQTVTGRGVGDGWFMSSWQRRQQPHVCKTPASLPP